MSARDPAAPVEVVGMAVPEEGAAVVPQEPLPEPLSEPEPLPEPAIMLQEEMPAVMEDGDDMPEMNMPAMNDHEMMDEPAIPMERNGDVMPAEGGHHMMDKMEGDEMMGGMMGGCGHHGHDHHGHGHHHGGGGHMEKGMGMGGWMHHP